MAGVECLGEPMIERHAETPIRIFLLIQNRLLRDAMHRLFRTRAGFVVAGCSSPEDCSRPALLESKCDVLVLDSLDAGWLPSNLHVEWETVPLLRCLLISMADDFDQFFAAIKGGATGYVLKDASAVEVVAAVQATHRGEAACPPTLCAELFRRLFLQAREPPGASAPNALLTIRQHRLAALAAKGMTNKEIASCLNLSEFTVRNHMHRIMKRVGVRSRKRHLKAVVTDFV
jgi:two-component system response regulator DevR